MKDKIKTTILVLEHFNIKKTIPGIISADKEIEEKEKKFPEFQKLKSDIDSNK